MSEEPMDLSPLDPEDDPKRTDRVVGAAMGRIAPRAEVAPIPRVRLAGAASLLLALLVGAGAGWAARDQVVEAPRARTLAVPADQAGPSVELANVFDALDVTDEQRARIRTAIETREPESDELLLAVAREMDRLLAARDESIRQVLDADQRSEYDRRLSEEAIIGFRRQYLTDRARVTIEAVLEPER